MIYQNYAKEDDMSTQLDSAGQIERLQNFAQAILEHGGQLLTGMILLIAGVLISKWIISKLRVQIGNRVSNPATVSMITNTIGVLLYATVTAATAIQLGAHPGRVMATLMFITLIAIAIIILFRPLLPSLPFKVGNTVKLGNLLGKIEATSILNTRVRTFDGKTFFVPNRQILDDIVINYHFTETRRVKINVTIRYDQDLLHAKQLMETVMREDARVLAKPAPVVFVLELGAAGVKIGARCWVKNVKFWRTKCDLTEKLKYRFDYEGVRFAYPQMDVNHYYPEDPNESEEILEDLENVGPEA